MARERWYGSGRHQVVMSPAYGGGMTSPLYQRIAFAMPFLPAILGLAGTFLHVGP